MPRQALPLECSKEDKTRLIAIRKSRTENARIVERAKIVLARVAGKEISQVAHDLKVSVPTVTKWCKRFSLRGLRGLLDDPRPGKPPKYDASFRDQVLSLLVQSPPEGMSSWEVRALAGRLGSSLDAVWHVLRDEGIYLRRRRTWRAVTDIELVPKSADMIGLYLNPPLNAAILSASETPSPKAIERPLGYVEIDSGPVARTLKRDFRRHGVLRLSATLEAGTGQRRTRLTERQRRADFQAFLGDIVAEQPLGREIHAIVDSGSMNREWLAAVDGRVKFHFTPTSAQWLTVIEILFSFLSSTIVIGVDDKVGGGLRNAIELFIRDHNEFMKPFRWRKGEIRGGGDLGNTLVKLCN
jgi:transposase